MDRKSIKSFPNLTCQVDVAFLVFLSCALDDAPFFHKALIPRIILDNSFHILNHLRGIGDLQDLKTTQDQTSPNPLGNLRWDLCFILLESLAGLHTNTQAFPYPPSSTTPNNGFSCPPVST